MARTNGAHTPNDRARPCDIVADALFANLARAHASVRRLAEACEGLASFRARREPAWYPAAA